MPTNSQRGFAPAILLFLIALIAVGAGAYLYSKGSLKLPTQKQPASSGAQVSRKYNSSIPKEAESCEEFTAPEGWGCGISVNKADKTFTIDLANESMNISVSNLGSGMGPCEAPDCVTKSLYSDDKVTLSDRYYVNDHHEVRGFIRYASSTPQAKIHVGYSGLKTRHLTTDEVKQVVTVLKSIKFPSF